MRMTRGRKINNVDLVLRSPVRGAGALAHTVVTPHEKALVVEKEMNRVMDKRPQKQLLLLPAHSHVKKTPGVLMIIHSNLGARSRWRSEQVTGTRRDPVNC